MPTKVTYPPSKKGHGREEAVSFLHIASEHRHTESRTTQYRFYTHMHPYVGAVMQELLKRSVRGLQAADTDYLKKPDGSFQTLPDGSPRPRLYAEVFTKQQYDPTELVETAYPVHDLDFTPAGAYSVYNWELFFHVPLTIGVHLSKNQRFAEAQQWFHFLFDPTDDSDGPTPERFWKVRPFHTTDVKRIEEILVNLSTGEDPVLRDATIRSIEAWKDNPFKPHVVARYRQQAFMYRTVMAYLDNLIAWGDSLFRQDTMESIDEAMSHYVLAANILGPRPLATPTKGTVRVQNYANLRHDLDKFGNAMRQMEAEAPFDLMPLPSENGTDDGGLATLRSLGNALYFGVPRNDKLLGYWETVADRLFKIRNSLNMQGVFRRLALFDPPIDPAMLARAAAAGLDVGAIVNGVNQPLPLVRFRVLARQATELAQEVKSLGGALLSAMEKEDGEALALLRAKHERVVLEMVEQVKYGQLQEAAKSKEALLQSLTGAVERYAFYERQLGRSADEIESAIPEVGEFDQDSLAKFKFRSQEPEVKKRDLEMDIASDLGESGGRIVSSFERQELQRSREALQTREMAGTLDMVAKILALIPEIGGRAEPMGVGVAIEFGGRALSTFFSANADGLRMTSDRQSFEAAQAGKIASFGRRELDWTYQSNLAANEINQIFKQLRAAQIREAVAEMELKSHRQQIEHARDVEHFLNSQGTERDGKKTNQALYTWMKRETKALHGQFFQFAFDVAKKAERALRHELGRPDAAYLQFGYMAGKEGLLAGEKLHLDVKRMEVAYDDLNQREYELTRGFSLMQIDPVALIELRATGRCTLRLPEQLFDADGPGHYFRRIRSVALSIPCVTGPHANVNCTVTLTKSSVRKTQTLADGEYARQGAEDPRFDDYFGSLQSVVTSTAQKDAGVFHAELGGDRYLPFEYSGAISEWQLQLPANPAEGEPAQFDYKTISDVILHMRYTARQGGGLLRQGAIVNLREMIDASQAAGSVRLFSVRHDFPTEWARFKSQTPGNNERYKLALNLRREHYPFWCDVDSASATRVALFARSSADSVPATVTVHSTIDTTANTAPNDDLGKDTTLGNLLVGELADVPLPAQLTGEYKLFFDDTELDNVWIALTWGA